MHYIPFSFLFSITAYKAESTKHCVYSSQMLNSNCAQFLRWCMACLVLLVLLFLIFGFLKVFSVRCLLFHLISLRVFSLFFLKVAFWSAIFSGCILLGNLCADCLEKGIYWTKWLVYCSFGEKTSCCLQERLVKTVIQR